MLDLLTEANPPPDYDPFIQTFSGGGAGSEARLLDSFASLKK